MIKKIFALVGILLASTLNANAAGEAMFSKGHSTWTVAGVACTANATDITGSIAGFDISAYRIGNLDTATAVYIGHDNLVSNDATNARVGEKLTAGSSGVWEIGKNPDLAQRAVKLWCRSAAGSIRLSLALFGYK